MNEKKRLARRVRRLLLPLQKKAHQKKHLIYSGNPEIDKLIFSDPFAFLIGVIADQMLKSERVWLLPFLLKKRLGHLNPRRIAVLEEHELEKVLRNPTSLHRFPRTMAHWFITAARIVVKRYGSDAANIWRAAGSAAKIQEHLREFPGISQKKSFMATKMLIRDWEVGVSDLATIDLPYDVHIRRVLVRTGLAENDSLVAIQKSGRLLNPDYPAAFDDAIWLVGRRFCHPQNPDHSNCPLGSVCAKLMGIPLRGVA